MYMLDFFRPSPVSCVNTKEVLKIKGTYGSPLLLSTAISLRCRIFGCDSIFKSLISRRAVIGNFGTEGGQRISVTVISRTAFLPHLSHCA